jgi:hypothetical protein
MESFIAHMEAKLGRDKKKKNSLMMMKPLVIILRKGKNWPLKFLLLQKLSRFVCVPFYLQANLEQLCWKIIIILNMCFAKHLLGMKLMYLLFSISDLSYIFVIPAFKTTF